MMTAMGILLILVGFWQFYFGVRAFGNWHSDKVKITNFWIMMAYWYNFYLAFILILLGIAALTGIFG